MASQNKRFAAKAGGLFAGLFRFFLEVFVGIFFAMLRTGHPAGMYTRALAPAGYDMRAGAFCIDD